MAMPARDDGSALTPIRAWAGCAVLAVLAGGCGGYWPLRKPSGHQWTSDPASAFSIQFSGRAAAESSPSDTRSLVTVAIEFLDHQQTREAFHADLLAHHIQPLNIRIDNGSPQAYQFRKADVGVPLVSAEEASDCVSRHPAVAVARWVKWAVFFLPGLFFDTVLEPTSTLEFPGIREASQWPAENRQAIREEFLRREIPDGAVSSKAVLEGVLFIRPLPRGQLVPVSLEDLGTHEPLRFEVPTPAPTYRLMRSYVQPEEVVWNVAVRSAKAIATWRVVSVDPTHRLIAARKTSGWWFWGRSTPLTVMLSGGPGAPTRVMVESAMALAAADGDARHSRTIDAFFNQLDRRLPSPPPSPDAPSDAFNATTSKSRWQEDVS